MELTEAPTTEQCMFYEMDGAVRQGGLFTLFREKHHTAEDVRIAKAYIRTQQDVVSFQVEKVGDEIYERVQEECTEMLIRLKEYNDRK